MKKENSKPVISIEERRALYKAKNQKRKELEPQILEEAKRTLAYKLADLSKNPNPALSVPESAVFLKMKSSRTIYNKTSGKKKLIPSYKNAAGDVEIFLKDLEAYKKLVEQYRAADIMVIKRTA